MCPEHLYKEDRMSLGQTVWRPPTAEPFMASKEVFQTTPPVPSGLTFCAHAHVPAHTHAPTLTGRIRTHPYASADPYAPVRTRRPPNLSWRTKSYFRPRLPFASGLTFRAHAPARTRTHPHAPARTIPHVPEHARTRGHTQVSPLALTHALRT